MDEINITLQRHVERMDKLNNLHVQMEFEECLLKGGNVPVELAEAYLAIRLAEKDTEISNLGAKLAMYESADIIKSEVESYVEKMHKLLLDLAETPRVIDKTIGKIAVLLKELDDSAY